MNFQPTLWFFTLILAFNVACTTPQDFDGANKATFKTEKIMKGTIISESFVNKGGKEISTIQDLYFETNGESYFIKFMDSDITYDEVAKYLNQTIEIEGEIKDGFWDIPDADPAYAQSRTGEYLIIYKINN